MVHVDDIVTHCFKCKKVKGQRWKLMIPKDTIKLGTFNYEMCAVVEHYNLEIFKGKVQVVEKGSIALEGDLGYSLEEDVETLEQAIEDSEQQHTNQANSDQGSGNNNRKVATELVEEVIIAKNIKEDLGNLSTPITESAEPAPEGNAPVTKRAFNFIQIDHPYSNLKDKGETDKKVRAILKQFSK